MWRARWFGRYSPSLRANTPDSQAGHTTAGARRPSAGTTGAADEMRLGLRRRSYRPPDARALTLCPKDAGRRPWDRRERCFKVKRGRPSGSRICAAGAAAPISRQGVASECAAEGREKAIWLLAWQGRRPMSVVWRRLVTLRRPGGSTHRRIILTSHGLIRPFVWPPWALAPASEKPRRIECTLTREHV
jgi:hypothetical protein